MSFLLDANNPLEVLVVDDNRDSADTLKVLLQMWGHKVRVAYGGNEALQAAISSPPDCILLDINMPDMDGYAVAAKLRQRSGTANVKLIALTAYSDAFHLDKIWEVGFDCYLNKLGDLSDVKRVLQRDDERLQLN